MTEPGRKGEPESEPKPSESKPEPEPEPTSDPKAERPEPKPDLEAEPEPKSPESKSEPIPEPSSDPAPAAPQPASGIPEPTVDAERATPRDVPPPEFVGGPDELKMVLTAVSQGLLDPDSVDRALNLQREMAELGRHKRLLELLPTFELRKPRKLVPTTFDASVQYPQPLLPDLRDRVDFYLNEATSVPGRVAELGIALLIIAVCTIFVVNTSTWISAETRYTLVTVEWAITVFFLVEYLIRWWAKRFSWRYLLTPLALIDLIAILPLFLPARLQFMRVLRLFRILRLIRLVQRREFFFGVVRPEHLIVMRILLTIFCIVFVTGGIMYELEHDSHPDEFHSMYDGIYFAIVTLTTVGFGDVTPHTWGGRLVTMIAILVWIVIIPWQLTTLVRVIVHGAEKSETICDHCGLKRHDRDASHCKACGQLIYLEYEGIE